MQYLVKHTSNRPNITLRTVRLLFKQLKRHVKRTSNTRINLYSLVSAPFCQSEIAQLNVVVSDHDVGGFEVPILVG